MTIPRPRKDKPFVVVLGKKFFVDGRLGSNELTLEQLAKTSRGLAHLNNIAATSDEHWKVVSAVTTDFSPVAQLVKHAQAEGIKAPVYPEPLNISGKTGLSLDALLTDHRGGFPDRQTQAATQRLNVMSAILGGNCKVVGVVDVTALVLSGHYLTVRRKDRLGKAVKHFDKKARKAGKELRFNI
jgi:hypothetical protein